MRVLRQDRLMHPVLLSGMYALIGACTCLHLQLVLMYPVAGCWWELFRTTDESVCTGGHHTLRATISGQD